MKLEKIKDALKGRPYDFLRTDKRLVNNFVLVGLGGSHAYGTETESSDLDIRGCALNSKKEILLNKDFEQVTDAATDTTIYSFNKLISLLTACNPNTIEILGLKQEHYLYLSDIGKQLIENKKMFLSQQAVQTFGGYAYAQLRRLDNKAARLTDVNRQEEHILNTLKIVEEDLQNNLSSYNVGSVNLYLDKSNKSELESEIYMDVSFSHYPLRDFNEIQSKFQNVLRDYARVGKRNQNAIEHNKLAKHSMHLIRLYMMCIDILEREEIITYREKEHDLLMDIRNGVYLDSNRQPTKEFFELVEEYKCRFEYARNNSSLPLKPDINKIEEFKAFVNEEVVKGCLQWK